MLTLAWPACLLLLPLPWLLRRRLRPTAGGDDAALRLPRGLVLAGTASAGVRRPPRLALLLLWLAWTCLLLAAARPQWLGEPGDPPASGRDILLAIDLSGSMAERDFQAADGWIDRLTATRQVAGEFIERRTGDRIGLILFASEAYLQAPLTFDRATVRRLLDEAFIGLAGRETAIGDAIGLAVRRFDAEETPGERVLVLLTDGVNNTGELQPLEAAGLAARRGVRIYTIGVGSDGTAGRLPAGALPRRPVDLDEPGLIRIAEMTGGQYFRAADTAALADIYQVLDRLEPVVAPASGLRPRRELYPWPLAAALLLFAGLLARRYAALPDRVWRRAHA
ncbi:MAG: VWA domain-containing protein [Gammaproteobacteria bacterium]|nr:MAG: VWA domain-containing protein [Gammaproteobacteria bacterium]